jgi:hypothetical protein
VRCGAKAEGFKQNGDTLITYNKGKRLLVLLIDARLAIVPLQRDNNTAQTHSPPSRPNGHSAASNNHQRTNKQRSKQALP